jgi:molybdopterin-guanine dinucleotide biosynthesis protein A
MTAPALPPAEVTLGILAGGRATRLHGRDKAWLEREGVPQVLRWTRRFANEVSTVLVSANRGLEQYAAAGLRAVPDARSEDVGPIAGLEALATACTTPWLMTLPVDLFGVNDCLLPTLAAERSAAGAFAQDEDGAQPLVALWQADALREGLAQARAGGEVAVHALQARLGLRCVVFRGVRFGNLNTPADLVAAGIDPGSPEHG